MMQSRRSLLVWKVFGERLDGWQNDDFPSETIPGDPTSLRHKGKPVPDTPQNREICRTSATPAASCRRRTRSKAGKVAAAERRGPADARALDRPRLPDRPDYDPKKPDKRGSGWMLDDQRPTLTLTLPASRREHAARPHPDRHARLGTGLDMASLKVTADFSIDGVSSGKNAAGKFREISPASGNGG